ncbi:hypothetical protein HMPREF9374_3057 [Desmospora sp. 8437]|nr:hypothetical protein HMPREF9374_3057 [Desmospora sp. 8437]
MFHRRPHLLQFRNFIRKRPAPAPLLPKRHEAPVISFVVHKRKAPVTKRS